MPHISDFKVISPELKKGLENFLLGKVVRDFDTEAFKITEVIFYNRPLLSGTYGFMEPKRTDILIDGIPIDSFDDYCPDLYELRKVIHHCAFRDYQLELYKIEGILYYGDRKHFIENIYRIDENLRKEKYVSGLPNLFYIGENIADVEKNLPR
jgi:hypothetical protein